MGDQSAWRWLIPAFVALTTGAAAYYLGKSSSDDRMAEKKNKRAFLLLIQQEYKSIRDRDVFIEMFKPLAKYVKQHEPETLAYELSVSDKDPHKLLIFERYSSKEALTEIHQQSAPFKKFKEQWTAANLEYTSKTGESYLEEDLGFM
ncbi:g1837 [Coccomyxa viridis]|uniref:G1837 protein n=1 Tax=Coccomyxa viridis TaxID=1274662 RepID=A0ABP1FIX5_9CHLO